MKVLVADDEAISRRILQVHFGKAGYEVILAADGEEAWEQLRRPDGPSLAVVDWMMPSLDGLALCRRVREQAREPYVYLLLLTGRGERADVIAGLEAGADDYLTKPFDPRELEVRLRVGKRIVSLHQELIQAREALRYRAMHDDLTGVSTRGAVLEELGRESARCARAGWSICLLLVDLDHFKAVNDTHGHPAGDAVLREASRRLRAGLRSYDLLGRYGGEEFLVALPGCDGVAGSAIAERLRHALSAAPIVFGDVSVAVTASFGLAAATGRFDPAELIGRADKALYRAKDSGRNRVEAG